MMMAQIAFTSLIRMMMVVVIHGHVGSDPETHFLIPEPSLLQSFSRDILVPPPPKLMEGRRGKLVPPPPRPQQPKRAAPEAPLDQPPAKLMAASPDPEDALQKRIPLHSSLRDPC